MEAEARRIKMSAEYQSKKQQAIERMDSQEIIDESEYEDERSDNSEPGMDEGVCIGRRFIRRSSPIHAAYFDTS